MLDKLTAKGPRKHFTGVQPGLVTVADPGFRFESPLTISSVSIPLSSSSPGIISTKLLDTETTLEFRQSIDFLSSTLNQIIEEHGGQEALEKIQQLRILSIDARNTTNQEEREAKKAKMFTAIEALDIKTTRSVIRALTINFLLRNETEKLEIIRKNRTRQRISEMTRTPRKESIAYAIYELKQRGVLAEELNELLKKLSINPVFTAHPTEMKRPMLIKNLTDISHSLTSVERDDLLDRKIDSNISRITGNIRSLWTGDLLRAEKPTVFEEAANTIPFVVDTAFDTVLTIDRDLKEALEANYPDFNFDLEKPIVKYSSWVGGDRDGNPNVTPELTSRVASLQALYLFRKYKGILQELETQIIASTDQVSITPELEAALKRWNAEEPNFTLDEQLHPIGSNEKYRQALHYISNKVKLTDSYIQEGGIKGQYKNKEELIADLQLIADSLKTHGSKENADAIANLILQVKTFGFHLADLDVRQHSKEHQDAISDSLSVNLGLASYAELDEEKKVELLNSLLRSRKKVIINREALSDKTKNVLETLEAIKHTQGQISKEAIRNYLISFTQSASDVLEVMLLAKEAGLIHVEVAETGKLVSVNSPINIAPLFETGDDLNNSSKIMQELYENEFYQAYLKSRNNYQQIMLGYSDGTKDSGFLGANVAILDAQIELAKVSSQHGIDWEFFHGRGGSLGRGGGQAGKAILSLPPGTINHRIRVTEQGEVISLRWSLEEMAHRHLEGIISATLLAEKPSYVDPVYEDEVWPLMKQIAQVGQKKYRELVYSNDDYWNLLQQSTPLRFIGDLNCGSRPAKRTGLSTLVDLRAIPWMMSHNFKRSCIPAWFGVGTALQELDNRNGLPVFRNLFNRSNCLKTLFSNCELALIRADGLYITKNYDALATPSELSERIYGTTKVEYDLSMFYLRSVTEGQSLVSPVIKQSVTERNPDTDILNGIQITLLRRLNGTKEPKPDEKLAMLETMNGLVAAMYESG